MTVVPTTRLITYFSIVNPPMTRYFIKEVRNGYIQMKKSCYKSKQRLHNTLSNMSYFLAKPLKKTYENPLPSEKVTLLLSNYQDR
jgi:hypothetical protein